LSLEAATVPLALADEAGVGDRGHGEDGARGRPGDLQDLLEAAPITLQP